MTEFEEIMVPCLGKTRYESKGEVVTHIREIQRRSRKTTKRKLDFNPYRCGKCHGWHLGQK